MNIFDDKHNFIRETHKPFTPLPTIYEERTTKQKWRPMSISKVFIAHHSPCQAQQSVTLKIVTTTPVQNLQQPKTPIGISKMQNRHPLTKIDYPSKIDTSDTFRA
jgi:hypothetical protein